MKKNKLKFVLRNDYTIDDIYAITILKMNILSWEF